MSSIEVMFNRQEQVISLIGSADDGVMSVQTFCVPLDEKGADKLHRDLGEALKALRKPRA